ncbi:MAG: hypothetical protein ACRDA3_03775 [Peptostreptococcaceae bacterium]
MQIEQLDLETRSKIYSHTKKVLRKYQKGIISGKLTANNFADNIISDGSISGILDENTLSTQDFKQSYIDYIETLINIQNENLSNGKKKKNKIVPEKPTVPQKIKLKNLLASSNSTLTIPVEYLNSEDVDIILEYLDTGSIALGNERIYNYVNKSRPS